jgi:hypothetical protein
MYREAGRVLHEKYIKEIRDEVIRSGVCPKDYFGKSERKELSLSDTYLVALNDKLNKKEE